MDGGTALGAWMVLEAVLQEGVSEGARAGAAPHCSQYGAFDLGELVLVILIPHEGAVNTQDTPASVAADTVYYLSCLFPVCLVPGGVGADRVPALRVRRFCFFLQCCQ